MDTATKDCAAALARAAMPMVDRSGPYAMLDALALLAATLIEVAGELGHPEASDYFRDAFARHAAAELRPVWRH